MSYQTISIVSMPLLITLASIPPAQGQVVVSLIPDNPGPYIGGESLTVDVRLRSEVSSDVLLDLIQFDFTDTNTALILDPAFTFDYSSIPSGNAGGYLDPGLCPTFCPTPQLPVPWTAFVLGCVCTPAHIPLPAGGSLPIGSIGVRLPTDAGVYRLDVLNADVPDDVFGGAGAAINQWRAFTGEITGGAFHFIVGPSIPTVSELGLVVTACLLVILGSVTIMYLKKIHPSVA